MDESVRDAVLRALQDLAEASADDGPDLTAAPILSEWVLVTDDGAPYLVGRVTGHPRLKDGRLVATSSLVAMATNCSWARTLNTLYALGRPMSAGAPH